jgi:hypothetical protein
MKSGTNDEDASEWWCWVAPNVLKVEFGLSQVE